MGHTEQLLANRMLMCRYGLKRGLETATMGRIFNALSGLSRA